MIELSRHRFHGLAEDDECVLYRARSEEDGSEVLVLTPAVQYPAPDVLKRLEHEYSLREELDREWAVRPLTLNRRGGQVMLVLEDPSSAVGWPIQERLGHRGEPCKIIGLRLLSDRP